MKGNKSNMIINDKILGRLRNSNIFIEEYYVLFSKYAATGWTNDYRPKPATYNKLVRLGLLDDKYTLTSEGRELTESCLALGVPEFVVPTLEETEDEFETWWLEFPLWDNHGRWVKTRKLRINKTKARKIYNKLMGEGVTPEELSRALAADVKFRKDVSIKENKLSFIPNPARWLADREFEAFLNEEKKEVTPDEQGQADIE